MILNTKHFGKIDVDEEKIISFEDGIPGFENQRRFIVLYDGEEGSPFRWMQSIDDTNLAFAVVEPMTIVADYDGEIPLEAVEKLEIEKPEEIMVLSIVVVTEDVEKISMNLKAPIIINTKNNKGMQVVLDTDRYCVRHYIVEELGRQEVKTGAGVDTEEKSVYSGRR
ncbi:flagellar assembly protein FliW [Herbivorax sp. ANBcel31]|uniref:flagellar assembly protein FliW n=1 Tax=Herbivorax sp. ANBcel31 TaxID=3069754 RepID=UPI0027B04F79|nr:flagellar assembly protein FliW [Herbivorax sp. ANBcel31]MDQ2085101.1 flagellar assembly protein FliW [Herbivorax sp. ANBcel31]